MDNETQKIISDGEVTADYVKAKGWKKVKQKFTEKILDLQSIKNLDVDATAENIIHDIKVRNSVVEVLMEIIQEIEGEAEQYEGNRGLTTPSIEII